MPPRLRLLPSSLDLEALDLALERRLCTRESLAAHLKCDPTAISKWRERGSAPPYLLAQLLVHLAEDGPTLLIALATRRGGPGVGLRLLREGLAVVEAQQKKAA